MVTMVDVARVAGVSVTTVSHVINGSRRVDPKTAAAVRAAIESTGYLNDRVAGSLRSGSTRTIGLAMSMISNPYFSHVVHVIESEITRAGYSLLLSDTHDEPGRELRAVSALMERRIDGLVLAASPDPSVTLERIDRRGIPTVLVDRLATVPFDQVGVENTESSARLVAHLAELGHTRVGMVAGLSGLATSVERIEGFRLGLRRGGVEPVEDLIRDGGSNAEDARAAMHALMSLADPPTAVFIANNQMTIGVMRALVDLRIKVPDQIAMVVFDDFEWADLFHPRLTAAAQPIRLIGERAVHLLLSRIADPSLPVRVERLETELVHRESCGCVADGIALTSAGEWAAGHTAPAVWLA